MSGGNTVLKVAEWPLSERPRQRLEERGAASLSDAELLSLLIGSAGRASGGVLETCRRLLVEHQGIWGLSRCSVRELRHSKGIGLARACALCATFELGRRILEPRDPRQELNRSEQVYRYLRKTLRWAEEERFWCLALDAKNRALAVHQVAQGSATAVEVHPRELFRPLIREGAVAAIVAHNHPSGDPEPSPVDLLLTRRLCRAGSLLGIPLLDHVIVGAGCYVSLADRGLCSDELLNER